MLPASHKVRKLVQDAAAKGMAVAELEYLGLSARTIQVLEESKYKCVYLRDLIKLKTDQLIGIHGMGSGCINEINEALRRFPELEEQRNRWHRSTERVEMYKAKLKNKSFVEIMGG